MLWTLSLPFVSAHSSRCLLSATLWMCCPKWRPCVWPTEPCLTAPWEPLFRTCRPTPSTSVVSSSESKVHVGENECFDLTLMTHSLKTWCFIWFSSRFGLYVASSGIRPTPIAQDAWTEGQKLPGLCRDDSRHQLHPLQGQKQGETEAEDARRAERQDSCSQEACYQECGLVQAKEQEGAEKKEGSQKETRWGMTINMSA